MQTIIALDTQLDKLHEHQNMIDQALNAAIKLANWDMVEKFSKLKLKTIENIGKFVSAKINLVNTPTYDIFMEIGQWGREQTTSPQRKASREYHERFCFHSVL